MIWIVLMINISRYTETGSAQVNEFIIFFLQNQDAFNVNFVIFCVSSDKPYSAYLVFKIECYNQAMFQYLRPYFSENNGLYYLLDP